MNTTPISRAHYTDVTRISRAYHTDITRISHTPLVNGYHHFTANTIFLDPFSTHSRPILHSLQETHFAILLKFLTSLTTFFVQQTSSMSANDILDVLNVQRDDEPARKKSKSNSSQQINQSRQTGMARELYNLLGPNTPPVNVSGTTGSSGGVKDRRKAKV